MFGFRLLAIILGLLCLAAAVSMAFFECPRMAPVSEFFVRHLVPDTGVRDFIRSENLADVKIKNLIKYTLSGLAVGSLAAGLLFLAAAVNPLRMRPFIVVVMISSAAMVVAAVWQGIRLGIFKTWWIGDAAGGLLLLILLAALFPREKSARPVSGGGGEGEEADR
ncbi:MAG: hypothetical protein P9M08_12550 [Candidatus Erginobacter occultus]|nr:hypothetical protein [Candidatus Erginobacter occultus]